ncbi:MAG TPA: serine/threonine-protein kinase [Myxococcota bacterium]|nr:serine/threonine-protein kinase [Myxococcota bacterium]
MTASSDLPDLRARGYEAGELLGANAEGGRLTFRARVLAGGGEVVVKQFRFAVRGARWTDYDQQQREVQALRELDHPRIPKLVDAFATDDGFCLVQQYLPYPSMAKRQSFELAELRAIAASVLDVLVYLQSRVPPLFHRDVKPANLLVDKERRAYLVDFGLARAGAGMRSGSTVAVGTPGFMPPEQLFGRELTASSDLYGLGASLIALLSGRRDGEVGDLVDNSFRFRLDELPPSLPAAWAEWLGKLVAPETADRFPDARAALQALPSADAGEGEVGAERAARPSERKRGRKALDAAQEHRAEPGRRARDFDEAVAIERGGRDERARLIAARARKEREAAASAAAAAAAVAAASASSERKRTPETRSALSIGVAVAAVVMPLAAVGLYKALAVDDASDDAPAAGAVDGAEALEAASEPAPAKPETEEEKRDRWAARACDGVVECYTEAGYVGAIAGRAEADIGGDGHVVEARLRGDAPRPVRACIVERMSAKSVPDYDGGNGVIFCDYSGQVMGGGAMMISDGSGWSARGAGGGEGGGRDDGDGAAGGGARSTRRGDGEGDGEGEGDGARGTPQGGH